MSKVDTSGIKRVEIVGAGGVGFWLAAALCREPVGRLIRVWDDDTFDGGRGAWRLPSVGDPRQGKIQYLEGFVEMVMGDKAPLVRHQRVTPEVVRHEESLLAGVWREALVVDCTDMAQALRLELWQALREVEVGELMRVSYDGNGVVYAGWGLPLGGGQGGYSQVPSLAQSYLAAGLGAAMVHKYLQGERLESMLVEVGASVEL